MKFLTTSLKVRKKFVGMERLSFKYLIYLYHFYSGRTFILFETK